MPEVRLDFYAVCRKLAGGVLVATPLLTPEVSSMGTRREKVLERLAKNLREFFVRLPPLERHRRVIGGQPEPSELMLTIEPSRNSPAWREPLELRLPYVVWMQQDRQRAALVPALELSLVADDDELPELLKTEALATLKRRGLTKSFAGLSRLMRDQELTLEPFSVSLDLPTPRQWAQQGEDDKKPVLAEVATRLAPPLEPAFEVRPLVRRMAETLTGRRPRSVLLVGPSGVGKTALFRELARNAVELKADAYQFWITSGSRLIAGALGFGGWQERCEAVCREAAKGKIVLHVGHLWELAEVGKCGGSAGIGEFLRPSIERGELLAVAECTSEQHTLLERENPGLLEAFTELRIAEPDLAHGQRILEQEARRLAGSGPAAIAPDALEELDRLHRRYATASVAPGRPLRFLRNLIEDRQDQRQPVPPEGVMNAFSRETGLPLRKLDRDLRAMVALLTSLEDRAMLAIYAGSGEALPPELREELQLAAEQWDHLLFDLYEHQTGADATSLLLGIYSADVDCVLEVAALYLDLAKLQQYESRLWALASCRGDLKRKLPEGAFRVGQPPAETKRQPADETVLEAHPLKDSEPRSGRSFEPVGILLELRGRLARAFFGGEGGLHTQKRTGKDPWRWLIHLADVAPQLYQPPEAIDRREGLARLERLREYVGWERFRDQKLGKVELGRETATALHSVLVARLRRQAEEAVVA